MSESRRSAVIVGAGIGGLSLGIRLAAMGWDTTIVEALDKPGGRAYVVERNGFTWDMGPTVITVPHFIEELFALECDVPALDPRLDYPEEVMGPGARVTEGCSGGPATSRYVELVPILPFYRIYFDDGTHFDYDGDPASTRAQIKAIEPEDLEGYERFNRDAKAIFERGFLELGYTHFDNLQTMMAVAPDLLQLGAVRTLFGFTQRYFRSDKLRQVFSFETLLVGGNPLAVPAIYAMIHFVEKTWGIHFAMGGTGSLIRGLVEKFEELGGTLMLNANVARIDVDDRPGAGLLGRKGVCKGITLVGGDRLSADIVVSNADWAHTYGELVDDKHLRFNGPLRRRVMRYSMSLVVVYFGFRRSDDDPIDLRHHNIILGPRYEGLLTDIFDNLVVPEDFSQYLHIPSLTDPSLAPEGHHVAYTLVPVAHNGSNIDWSSKGEAFVQGVLQFLEDRGYIPNLSERVVEQFFITPDYFEHKLQSHLGNAFGVEPTLTQSAWFRPHNRSEDIENLYMVGASAQPGAGTPSVMMSAKMTARAILEDHGRGLIAGARSEPAGQAAR